MKKQDLFISGELSDYITFNSELEYCVVNELDDEHYEVQFLPIDGCILPPYQVDGVDVEAYSPDSFRVSGYNNLMKVLTYFGVMEYEYKSEGFKKQTDRIYIDYNFMEDI